MKSDKEIALVEKKTNFQNFWKPIEELNNIKNKNSSNTTNNSVNLKKKKKLEIVGLSYVDPSKLNHIFNEKKNNNDNNNKKNITSKKKKKLLANFEIKLKEKGNEIISRQKKNKDLNLFAKKNNKTELNINKTYNNEENEEVGVPELSHKRRNNQNQKLNKICQISASSLNKYDKNHNIMNMNDNNYVNHTISSCRHSNTNGNIYYIKSATKDTKIYSNFNSKFIKNLKLKKNSSSLRTLDVDKNKIKYSDESLNFNNINQTHVNPKNNYSINNNRFNNNNNSYINTETRIYRKKISIRKNYKNNNEENMGSEVSDLKSSKNTDKPKTVRVKKLQLFKVPLTENKKIYKIDKKFKNDQKDINEVESD